MAGTSLNPYVVHFPADTLQNEFGQISSDSIIKYLGFSAGWMSKARKVVNIIERIGPGSPNPDPLVLERLSSKVTIHKGKDILLFLIERMEAMGVV